MLQQTIVWAELLTGATHFHSTTSAHNNISLPWYHRQGEPEREPCELWAATSLFCPRVRERGDNRASFIIYFITRKLRCHSSPSTIRDQYNHNHHSCNYCTQTNHPRVREPSWKEVARAATPPRFCLQARVELGGSREQAPSLSASTTGCNPVSPSTSRN